MRNAFAVLDAWGFEQKTILTWVKPTIGAGNWLRGSTEHCIMAVRGNPVKHLTNQTTALHAPRDEHSAKPREFYDMVEVLCPASRYADVFSRYRHNERWDCHGDEAPVDQAADHYDAEADFAGSIDVVRERVAAGGQPWVPKSPTVTAGSSESAGAG